MVNLDIFGNKLINRYGKGMYVVITGCSSGQGSQFASEFANKGFNLILRDIKKLFEYIREYQSLGLQIKDSRILEKFIYSRKPENLLFGLGINFTNKFFKHNQNTSLLKEIILKDIDKFKFLKKLSLKISDKGIFQ